jgi:hypothetical protein
MNLSRRRAIQITGAAALTAAALTPSLVVAQNTLTEDQLRLRNAFRTALAEYQKARAAYDAETAQYWQNIRTQQAARRTKRSNRQPIVESDYVLDHPPEYKGPAAPPIPDFMAEKRLVTPPPRPSITTSSPPVVADFLAAAKNNYGFTPRSTEERAYMLAFAREALAIGLSAEQVVGVYALETGGIGPYSRQSGVFTTNNQCQAIPPRGTPAGSLALGYVQLLPANSVLSTQKLVGNITQRLNAMAQTATPARAMELRTKATLIQRMVADVNQWVAAYTGPKNNWNEYVTYGRTPNGLAMHALNLDADVGPWIQAGKLLGIKQYAARQGINGLTSAQLELINLVGDGRGVDAMQPAAQNASSANFFDRSGYEGNPVAKNKTASGLLAHLAGIIERRKKECGSVWFFEAFETAERERIQSPQRRGALLQSMPG